MFTFLVLPDNIAPMTPPDIHYDLTIIIVTYNSAHVIERCLNSLSGGVPIIIVDNGSADDTIERALRFSSVEIVRSHNIGYGKAANIGLARATTSYALLLNPDTILCEGAISALLDCATLNKDIGIVGAQMINFENGSKHYRKNYEFDTQGVCYTSWIVGALMLFTMDIVRKVGLFDENIFLFYEETDLCDRFLKAGYKLAVCEKAEAVHIEGTSSLQSAQVTKIRYWHGGWSRAYYFRKRFGLGKSLRKSLWKIVRNNIILMRKLLPVKPKKSTLAAIYENMGIISYFIGLKAFRRDGTARITCK